MDTDVFSFMFGGDFRAARYRPHLQGRVAALSFQSIAELLQGAFQNNWGERRVGHLRQAIGGHVTIPFDMEMVEHFARLRAARRKAGREVGVADAWIAATALWADCPVVTHNRRDFDGIEGLQVITEAD
ncbi:MAG: PIN domain-containing protein [Chloroflexota bacterium]|nr:PIN domain-containing protein [Chloroflexota bacterium]